MRQSRVLLLVLLCAAIAAVILYWWPHRAGVTDDVSRRDGVGIGDAPSRAENFSSRTAPAAPGEEMQARFRQLIEQQRRLSEEIDVLRRQIERLDSLLGALATSPAPGGDADVAADAVPNENATGDGSRRPAAGVAALVDAGFDNEQAIRIQERLDQMQLDELYLRDRATREGWMGSNRYASELRRIRAAVDALRNEVGDVAYDRVLYALGRQNRVLVKNTMKQSPAEEFGLRPGDAIIEYNGRRIYTPQELASATTDAPAGTMVLVRVSRGGGPVDLYLPSGPMGIRLSTARMRP